MTRHLTIVLDCGGKRSATPLFVRPDIFFYLFAARPLQSAVAAALCRRSPKQLPDYEYPIPI